MGENPNASNTHQARFFPHELSYVRLLLIEVQILVGDLHRGHLKSSDGIRGQKQVLANNSRLKRVEDMGLVSLCLYCHDASTDIQYDLFGQTFDLR